MNRKVVLILIICISFAFSSCTFSNSYQQLMSVQNIVDYMNNNFEGTFVYDSSSSKNAADESSDSKYRTVAMKCTLNDGTVFDVVTRHSFLGKGYWSVFPSLDFYGTITTDYYSYIYGKAIDELSVEKLTDILSDYESNPGFKIFREASWYGTESGDASVKISSAEDYLHSVSGRDFTIVFFCNTSDAQSSNLNLFLDGNLGYNICYDDSYNWIRYCYVCFAPEYKDSSDQLTLDTVSEVSWKKAHDFINLDRN